VCAFSPGTTVFYLERNLCGPQRSKVKSKYLPVKGALEESEGQLQMEKPSKGVMGKEPK